MPTINSTEYINERGVYKITKRALPTLRNDRHLGRGIPYVRMGRSIRYKVEDVIAFMEARKVQTEPI